LPKKRKKAPPLFSAQAGSFHVSLILPEQKLEIGRSGRYVNRQRIIGAEPSPDGLHCTGKL
jgi:hypothetical protein